MNTEVETLETEIADLLTEIRHKQAEIFALTPKFTEEEIAANAASAKEKRNARYKTTNGLTIHKLRLAGNSVKVAHIRYADIPGVPVAVPVPSFMRGVHDFLPRGGATHILIVNDARDIYHATTSMCHEIDSFDYKLGVKQALDQIDQAAANQLLENLPADNS